MAVTITEEMSAIMDAQNKVALVTGANKGIGFEIARGLAERGASVFLGARNLERGHAAANELRGEGLDVTFLQVDVTDAASIEQAARAIEERQGRLDILVNNAGINLESLAGLSPLTTPLDIVRRTFETNVFGALAVIQAFLPLLSAAPSGRIINVTSELGSLSLASDPSWEHYHHGSLGYGPSKTTLNAITVAYAGALASTNIKVNAVCPGLTATDLTGNFGSRTAAQGAAPVIRTALLPADGPNGSIHNEAGVLPW